MMGRIAAANAIGQTVRCDRCGGTAAVVRAKYTTLPHHPQLFRRPPTHVRLNCNRCVARIIAGDAEVEVISNP